MGIMGAHGKRELINFHLSVDYGSCLQSVKTVCEGGNAQLHILRNAKLTKTLKTNEFFFCRLCLLFVSFFHLVFYFKHYYWLRVGNVRLVFKLYKIKLARNVFVSVMEYTFLGVSLIWVLLLFIFSSFLD